jgi:hypothetical protein
MILTKQQQCAVLSKSHKPHSGKPALPHRPLLRRWAACPRQHPGGARPARCRKNHLFPGSDAGGRRAAAMYTLIESAKLNGFNPEHYLTDVLACASPTTRPGILPNFCPGTGNPPKPTVLLPRPTSSSSAYRLQTTRLSAKTDFCTELLLGRQPARGVSHSLNDNYHDRRRGLISPSSSSSPVAVLAEN